MENYESSGTRSGGRDGQHKPNRKTNAPKSVCLLTSEARGISQLSDILLENRLD